MLLPCFNLMGGGGGGAKYVLCQAAGHMGCIQVAPLPPTHQGSESDMNGVQITDNSLFSHVTTRTRNGQHWKDFMQLVVRLFIPLQRPKLQKIFIHTWFQV